MSGSPPPPLAGASRFGRGWSTRVRRYWPAAALALAGLLLTFLAGWQVDRWSRASDAARFAAECRVMIAMVEQKMERYEAALARLRDACARANGEISYADWSGWLNTLQVPINYPAVRCLLVAPRILPQERDAFARRATNQMPGYPGTIVTSRVDAPHWAPVWRRYVRGGPEAPELGEDLLAPGTRHPALESALGATYGWISGQVNLSDPTEGPRNGIWFVIPLQPLEFTNTIRWQRPNEAEPEAAKRRWAQRAAQATGLLAAFMDGDRFLADFNPTNSPQLVAVQLFTSKNPGPETLLNPGHRPPGQVRLTLDRKMQWYGRAWTIRCHSTPVFEASSLRYRSWLVWGGGSLISLGMAAGVAWQTRGRLREEALAEQLRQALGQQERLSRDLHDGTLQSVYGVGLGLQRAQRLLEKRPAEAATQLAAVTQALQRVVGELRAVIRQSDPSAREEVPLGEALQGVVDHFKTASEMELLLTLEPGADHDLTPGQSLELLNIAREALSNSVRHSGARTVRITLLRHSDRLELRLEDDGRGFDPLSAASQGRGLGNLATRVRELGGSHRWEAAPGQGARLLVEIPLTTGSPPAAA